MMKKSFAFMAAAVLALARLTGCGSGGKVTSTSNDLCFGKDDTVTSELLDFMELEGGFLGVLYD